MMILPEHVAYMGDLVVEGRIILQLILRKQGIRMWIEFNWLRIGFSGRLCRVQNMFKCASSLYSDVDSYTIIINLLELFSTYNGNSDLVEYIGLFFSEVAYPRYDATLKDILVRKYCKQGNKASSFIQGGKLLY
jgi:hypothetical protein